MEMLRSHTHGQQSHWKIIPSANLHQTAGVDLPSPGRVLEYESMNSDGRSPRYLLTSAATSSLQAASVITPNVTAGTPPPSGSKANSELSAQIKELRWLTDARLGWKRHSRRLE